MNTERCAVLSSFLEIAKSSSRESAIACLSDWMKREKASDVLKAGGYYLAHFVIPALEGEDTFLKPLPRWVDEQLFHPPLTSIENIQEWLSLFPGTSCEALNEREACGSTRLGMEVPLSTIELARDKNWGLYFTPNGYEGSRSKEHTTRLNAFFADFDDHTKAEQLEKIKTLPLAPSIIVESGRGYHTYWMLSAPSQAFSLWERIQRKIIAVCGSDKTIVDAARLMRLPFTFHTKYDVKPLVTIHTYTQKRYTFAEVEHAFPPAPEVVYLERYTGPRTLRAPDVRVLLPNQRHAALKEETGRIYARLPIEKAPEARAMLRDWYQRSCNPLKPYWEREVVDMCDYTEKKEYGMRVS